MQQTIEFCPNFHAIALQPSPIDQKRLFTRLRCKMWTCAYCAAKNRQIWRAKLIHHIYNTPSKWCWFTLTAHSKMRGSKLSLKNLRAGWDKLYHRMKRRFGKFSYARIYEKHADGSYHIHAIASFNFDDIKTRKGKDGSETTYSVWLAKNAKELSLGLYTHAANVDVDFENHAGFVASYITKYIVKLDVQTKSELSHIRHIQVSQDWKIKSVSENAEKWLFKFGIYYNDVAEAGSNYQFVDLQTEHKITLDDFETTYIYPPEFDHRT